MNVKTLAIRQITKDKGPWTGPVVSPDGKTIAYTGFAWTEQTYKAEEIHVIGRDGSTITKSASDPTCKEPLRG